MRRRDFITVLGSASVTWSRAARAQQREGVPRVGVLASFLENDPQGHANAAALLQGLNALHWYDGGNLRIDWRWAGGDPALIERYAAELVALGPVVLLALGSPSVEALRRQRSMTPIVFTIVSDPIGQGFVESLARPGGTITGFSSYDVPMSGKWLEMLTQINPPAARAAVLFNSETAPQASLLLHGIEEAAPSFAVEIRPAPVSDDAEIEATMANLAREEHGALLVLPGAFPIAHRRSIIALASRYRLAAVYPFRFFTADGGLMSYGIDQVDLFRRSASYIDRILKGEKAADLPVQAPTKFELVINLKTAKALGVTIAPTLLDTADEVIE